MKECRNKASSVVYNNQVIATGGMGKNGGMKSMERLSKNAVHARQFMSWEKLAVDLPRRLQRLCSIVFNGRLIVIDGYDGGKYETCDSISEVSLVQPYCTIKQLLTIPERCSDGVPSFQDEIAIFGGIKNPFFGSLNSVMYDIIMNECQELAPLPYSVSEMATVKWGRENVIIIGGVDIEKKPLNKVLIYNIKTQKCHMLPDMKHKRRGCVAAVVKDTVIVMGGQNERDDVLKSVECFKFDRYTWDGLPEMHEPRCWATAVVC